MGFLEDILNGGLDRDFDGDIDSHDRALFIEECIRNDENERQERIYSQQCDDCNEELDSEDFEDCDFDDDF